MIYGQITIDAKGDIVFGVSVPEKYHPDMVKTVLNGVALIATWIPCDCNCHTEECPYSSQDDQKSGLV